MYKKRASGPVKREFSVGATHKERNRSGAASFFPESSDEEMEDAGVDRALPVEEIESIKQTKGCGCKQTVVIIVL